MIAMFILAAAPLVHAFQDARDDLRIASPSVYDERVVHSIGVAVRAGTRAKVLLAPEASYQLDGTTVLIGADPYAKDESEFRALKRAKTEIFIDPRFNAVGARAVRPKRTSHMSFAVMGTGMRSPMISIICTGAMDQVSMATYKNICVVTDDKTIHAALSAEHRSDFDDTLPSSTRVKMEASASERLVLSPGGEDKLSQLFEGEIGQVSIYTAAIDQRSPIFNRIANLGPKVTVTVPSDTRTDDVALAVLAARGVHIERSTARFTGSMIEAAGKVFVGSNSLTLHDLTESREVGVVVRAAEIDKIVKLGGEL
jgi:hypothetical protein